MRRSSVRRLSSAALLNLGMTLQVEERALDGMTVAQGGPFSGFTMSDFRAPGGPIWIRKCFFCLSFYLFDWFLQLR